MRKRQWADKYGSRWYLHYDGRPPHDDDNDYVWRNGQWQLDEPELTDAEETALEEWEERRRERIARENEY
jgi:hypothetical protein